MPTLQPAGNDQGGLDGNVADWGVGGIEHERLPIEQCQLLRDVGRNDAVEMRVKGGDSFGNRHVKLVESTSSRRHASGWPLAVKTTPVMLATGPKGW